MEAMTEPDGRNILPDAARETVLQEMESVGVLTSAVDVHRWARILRACATATDPIGWKTPEMTEEQWREEAGRIASQT